MRGELRFPLPGPWKGIWQSQAQKQGRPTAMPGTSLQILVRETGLEPVWINRWILSPVRLPIPPLSQRLVFYHRHRFTASLGQPFPQYRTAGEAGAGTGTLRGAVLAHGELTGVLSADALPSQGNTFGEEGEPGEKESFGEDKREALLSRALPPQLAQEQRLAVGARL